LSLLIDIGETMDNSLFQTPLFTYRNFPRREGLTVEQSLASLDRGVSADTDQRSPFSSGHRPIRPIQVIRRRVSANVNPLSLKVLFRSLARSTAKRDWGAAVARMRSRRHTRVGAANGTERTKSQPATPKSSKPHRPPDTLKDCEAAIRKLVAYHEKGRKSLSKDKKSHGS
jgi:hypothetical protein